MGLPPGGTVNVRDATMALVTRSANDAAIVLAEALAGGEEAFARQMTQKARQLGMSSTVFRNASGLPNREQVTTARDMARLAHALMRDFPHYYAVFAVQSYPYRGRSLENHNRMLGNYEGADGLKTGYTAASGFNLVMSAMRDNRRLIGVVMGGDSAGQRDRQMAELMDRGFAMRASNGPLALDLASQAGLGPLHRRPSSTPAAAIAGGLSSVRDGQGPKPPANQPPAASPKFAGCISSAARLRPLLHQPLLRPPPATTSTPSVGSWVIQVGSFSEAQAAQLALERATVRAARTACAPPPPRRSTKCRWPTRPSTAHG